MQWLLGAIVLLLVVAVFWDAFARGRRGSALAWGIAAGAAAVAGGLLRGADVGGPWPLLGWIASAVLIALAIRAERRQTPHR